jgi:phage terminase small subunit
MTDLETKPPTHLRTQGKAFWRPMMADYELNVPETKLLLLLCEQIDLQHEARKSLKKNGLTFLSKTGTVKPRPELVTERQATRMISTLLRQLDFQDDEKPKMARVRRRRNG